MARQAVLFVLERHAANRLVTNFAVEQVDVPNTKPVRNNVRAKHVGLLVDGAVEGDFSAVLEANHSRAAMQNLELVVPGKANGYKNVDVGRGGIYRKVAT